MIGEKKKERRKYFLFKKAKPTDSENPSHWMVKRMQFEVGSQLEQSPRGSLIVIHHIKLNWNLTWKNIWIYSRNSKNKSKRQRCVRKIHHEIEVLQKVWEKWSFLAESWGVFQGDSPWLLGRGKGGPWEPKMAKGEGAREYRLRGRWRRGSERSVKERRPASSWTLLQKQRNVTENKKRDDSSS